jgi:hypothetical protein
MAVNPSVCKALTTFATTSGPAPFRAGVAWFNKRGRCCNKQGYPSHRDSMGRRNPAVNVRVHRRGNAADIAEPTAINQASRAEICRLSANLAATLFAGREAAA